MSRIAIALGVLLFLSSCHEEAEGPFEVSRDLIDIESDTLRIVISPGKLGLQENTSTPRGLEQAILSSFAKKNGLYCQYIRPVSTDSTIAMLRNGQADIAAGLFSLEFVNNATLAPSCAYNSSSLVLVAQRPDPWYAHYWGHRGYPAKIEQDYEHVDTIWQSHHQIVNVPLDSSQGLLTDPHLSPEELIEKVALGDRRSALVSKIVARAHSRDFPNLDMSTDLDGDVELVFAMRLKAVHLKGSLDTWLGSGENWAEIDALTSAYTDPGNRRATGAFSHPHHKGSEYISPFDDDFKFAAGETGWDWRFLAALAFKESRFDTAALSHKGALGLMQLVPSTAIAMEIDSSMGEAGAIHAAAKYLSTLDRMFRRSVKDKDERLGFILASYNAGPGHVFDAQRLAVEMGLDPGLWHGHVERALLLLSRAKYYKDPSIKSGYCKGHSVFLFVREVLHYWKHYKSIGIQ